MYSINIESRLGFAVFPCYQRHPDGLLSLEAMAHMDRLATREITFVNMLHFTSVTVDEEAKNLLRVSSLPDSCTLKIVGLQ